MLYRWGGRPIRRWCGLGSRGSSKVGPVSNVQICLDIVGARNQKTSAVQEDHLPESSLGFPQVTSTPRLTHDSHGYV